MKRKDLMKMLRQHAKETGQGIEVVEGGNHTRVTIGDKRTVVPRHNEVNELTTRAILKQIGVIK